MQSDSENIFFDKLKELTVSLKLDLEADIFGGMFPQEKLGKWQPRKKYGKIKDYSKK